MTTNARQSLMSKIATYILLCVSALFVLIPVGWMVSTSLKIESETLSIPPKWIPETLTFDAYARIWVDYPFLQYFSNSFTVVVFSVSFTVLFSVLAGYGVTRFNFKTKAFFVSFLLVTQMFPSVMLIVPYFQMFNTYGLDNTLTGLVMVYIAATIPFCSWLMIGYYKTIPISLDEAATIDGCNRLQVFYKIVLPLTKPGLVTTAIYAFIISWNDYLFAQTLITEPLKKTVPLGIAEFNGYYKIFWNDLMASSVMASIPIIILFIFLQKHFVSGLTAGAVK